MNNGNVAPVQSALHIKASVNTRYKLPFFTSLAFTLYTRSFVTMSPFYDSEFIFIYFNMHFYDNSFVFRQLEFKDRMGHSGILL